ncbi:hypothetical protein NOC27_3002 [Nitrosococcus oceani AFC27]|nr:hypothetical protein NOC27_3002 [Nitrosococcus oceani AFC27]
MANRWNKPLVFKTLASLYFSRTPFLFFNRISIKEDGYDF